MIGNCLLGTAPSSLSFSRSPSKTEKLRRDRWAQLDHNVVMSQGTTLSDESQTSPPPVSRGRFATLGRWLRRGLGLFGLIVLLALLVVLSPVTDRVYFGMDCQDGLDRADWIICLGGDGGRVLEGARLLQDGYAPKLIVTNRGAAANVMAQQAIEWGADPRHVLIEDQSSRTADHPDLVAELAGIERNRDRCIIVTSYTHMKRARHIFADAGYQHLIMREMRWQRVARGTGKLNWRQRLLVAPRLCYEAAGWCRYWLFG